MVSLNNLGVERFKKEFHFHNKKTDFMKLASFVILFFVYLVLIALITYALLFLFRRSSITFWQLLATYALSYVISFPICIMLLLAVVHVGQNNIDYTLGFSGITPQNHIERLRAIIYMGTIAISVGGIESIPQLVWSSFLFCIRMSLFMPMILIEIIHSPVGMVLLSTILAILLVDVIVIFGRCVSCRRSWVVQKYFV